jgi:hypothetical protein
MKRIVAVLFASAAVLVPASAAWGSFNSAQPLGFECLASDELDVPEATYAITNCGANRNQ